MDRGYAKFALFNKIVDANSSYVCRLRDNSAYEVVESRELTDADRAAGILSDQIVLIGQNGIALNSGTGQSYCAIIACLLISLWTGRKPTRRTYEMICFYFLGVASEEELLAHLTKLKRQDEASEKTLRPPNITPFAGTNGGDWIFVTEVLF